MAAVLLEEVNPNGNIQAVVESDDDGSAVGKTATMNGISQQLSERFKGNASNRLGAEIAWRAALPPPNGQQSHWHRHCRRIGITGSRRKAGEPVRCSASVLPRPAVLTDTTLLLAMKATSTSRADAPATIFGAHRHAPPPPPTLHSNRWFLDRFRPALTQVTTALRLVRVPGYLPRLGQHAGMCSPLPHWRLVPCKGPLIFRPRRSSLS